MVESLPVNDGHEVLPQLDLLEIYADREVSIFGITGTFRDLARMCPIDLSDPRITTENKNEFVAKAANEAGIEVEPQHEETFSRIIDQFGLERKFTVAKPVSGPDVEKNNISPQVSEQLKAVKVDKLSQRVERELASSVETNLKNVLTLNEEIIGQRSDRESDLNEAIVSAEKELLSKTIKDANAEQIIDSHVEKVYESRKNVDIVLDQTKNITKEHSAVVEHASIKDATAEQIIDSHVDRVRAPLEEAGPVPEQIIYGSQEQSIVIEPASVEVEMLMVDGDVFTIEHTTVMLEGANDIAVTDILDDEQPTANLGEDIETDAFVISNWEAELSKDPVEVLEDFIVAFVAFSDLMSSSSAINPEGDSVFGGMQVDSGETAPAPPILTTIIEKLSELKNDEKMFVAPMMKNIVGAIHGLKLLEQRGSNHEAIAEVNVHLRELCESLFDVLAIEYSDLDIDQFIELMLHPNFQLSQPDEEILDLEHMGTREAKKSFSTISSTLTGMESEIQKMLGMFAVFYARVVA